MILAQLTGCNETYRIFCKKQYLQVLLLREYFLNQSSKPTNGSIMKNGSIFLELKMTIQNTLCILNKHKDFKMQVKHTIHETTQLTYDMQNTVYWQLLSNVRL